MTDQAKLGVTQIGQIAIPIDDLDKGIEFYRDILELPFLFRTPDLAFFDCGGVRIMLGPPETSEHDRPSSIIYYQVPDIHAAYHLIQARVYNSLMNRI